MWYQSFSGRDKKDSVVKEILNSEMELRFFTKVKTSLFSLFLRLSAPLFTNPKVSELIAGFDILEHC